MITLLKIIYMVFIASSFHAFFEVVFNVDGVFRFLMVFITTCPLWFLFFNKVKDNHE